MKEREYLKELGKKITDSSVRKEIVNEYEAHIEDCKAALMESGMTEVEAEEEAVRQMGNPQEAGEAMDKIYHKVFDSNMFLWMLALGCIPIVCVCISYLIARDPNAFLWLWNDALGLNKIPAVIHRNIGIGLAVYGIGLRIGETISHRSESNLASITRLTCCRHGTKGSSMESHLCSYDMITVWTILFNTIFTGHFDHCLVSRY